MIETTLTVTNPKGIHARPSALITEAARAFDSRIVFDLHGETANAADIMEVLSLGAAEGDTILMTIDGDDEQAAVERMQEIFALNFGDD